MTAKDKVVSINAAGVAAATSARVVWLDQLRAVAMFFVVVGHVVAGGSRLETLLYSFHVPLFFMVSGMTFRPDRYSTIRECAIDKAKKLLVPYVLLSVAMIPWWLLNWRVLDDKTTGIPRLLIAILVSNQDIIDGPANQMWFLPALFLLSVYFVALWKWSHGKQTPIALLVAASGVAGGLLSMGFHREVPWHVHTLLTAAVFYYAGYVFMQHRRQIAEKIREQPHLLAAAVVGLFAVGTYFGMTNGKVSMHHNDYNSLLFFYLSAFSLSFATILAMMHVPTVKWLTYAGQNTLVYLAVHVPMIRTIQHLSPEALRFTHEYPVIIGAVVFVAIIPIAWLINRFLPFLIAKKYSRRVAPGHPPEAMKESA